MDKKKYSIELLLFMAYALFAMSWKVGDFIIAKMGFSITEIAIMTNAINIAKIIGCLSAATLISKIGNKKMFSYSTLLIVLGILIPAVAGKFSLIFLIRFVLGLGGAFVLVTINPIVAKIFSGEELVIVNGLNAVAFNVGLAIVLSLAPQIQKQPELSLKIITASLLLVVALWSYVSKELAEETNEQLAKNAVEYTMWEGLKDKFNWSFSLSYSGLLGFYLVSFTFMKPENVKYVIYAGVVGALVGSFKTKKIKEKLLAVRITSFLQVITATAFLFYYNEPVAKILGIMLGFLIFFIMPTFVTLAFTRKDVTPRKISVTFSIFWAVSYFVSIIIIQMFAFLKSTSGDKISFIFIICAEASLFLGTTLFMKREKE